MLYAIIAVYFTVLLLLGVLASRRVASLSDYYVGGKRLGYWVAAFSTRATGESAWLYLGLTGLGAAAGLSALWVVVGEVLGVGTAWFLMAAPFKRATDRSGAITVPDYLVSRFGSPETPDTTRRLRLVAAGALALFVTIYVSAQIDATGKAFASFLDWNYYTGALVGFAIVVVYTFTGGFLAVAWSDLFQGLLMLAGLVVLPVAAFAALEPGALTAGIDAALLNPWGPGGATLPNLLTIVSYAAIGVGFLGSPQVFVRFMAIRDQTQIRAGRWIAIGFTLATDTGAVLSGLVGRALLVGSDGDFAATLGPSGEQVLPVLVEHLFSPVVVGLFVAAVLAAIMSTIDSLLVVASSAVTRDVYQQTLHPDLAGETLIGLSRRVTLALALVALAVALSVAALAPGRTIFCYVIFGWSGIAATFCPVIVLSLVWRRYNAQGALASMVSPGSSPSRSSSSCCRARPDGDRWWRVPRSSRRRSSWHSPPGSSGRWQAPGARPRQCPTGQGDGRQEAGLSAVALAKAEDRRKPEPAGTEEISIQVQNRPERLFLEHYASPPAATWPVS